MSNTKWIDTEYSWDGDGYAENRRALILEAKKRGIRFNQLLIENDGEMTNTHQRQKLFVSPKAYKKWVENSPLIG